MATRVFVQSAALGNTSIEIVGEDHHHLTRSLRSRVGDRAIVSDGRGTEANGEITAIDKRATTIATGASRFVEREQQGYRMVAVVALLKGERMDYSIQKLVELGVDTIIPVATERAVVALDKGRAARRRERFDAIARSAARQCHRAWLPSIGEPTDLQEGLASLHSLAARLLFHIDAEAVPLDELLPPAGTEGVGFVVGPEGGLTDAERALCLATGWRSTSLGPLVLRAETAALAAASIIGHLGRSRRARVP